MGCGSSVIPKEPFKEKPPSNGTTIDKRSVISDNCIEPGERQQGGKFEFIIKKNAPIIANQHQSLITAVDSYDAQEPELKVVKSKPHTAALSDSPEENNIGRSLSLNNANLNRRSNSEASTLMTFANNSECEKYKKVLSKYPNCVFVKKFGDSGRGEVICLLDKVSHEELTIFV